MSRWVCLRCFESNEAAFTACQSCGLARGAQPERGEVHPGAIDPEPSLGRGMVGVLLRHWWVLLLIAAPIGGLIFNAQRGDGGAITRAGDLVVADLRVGDCFDLKDADEEEIDDVTARPCGESHEFELMFRGSLSSDQYPSEAAFTAWLEDNCLPAFAEYVGISFAESRLDIFWFQPTPDGWHAGDHSVQCAIYDPADAQLASAVRNVGR
jgi:hypothetical protein